MNAARTRSSSHTTASCSPCCARPAPCLPTPCNLVLALSVTCAHCRLERTLHWGPHTLVGDVFTTLSVYFRACMAPSAIRLLFCVCVVLQTTAVFYHADALAAWYPSADKSYVNGYFSALALVERLQRVAKNNSTLLSPPWPHAKAAKRCVPRQRRHASAHRVHRELRVIKKTEERAAGGPTIGCRREPTLRQLRQGSGGL